MLIIGAIGDFISFVALIVISFSTFNTLSFNMIGVVIPFVLMIIFSLMATCGFSLISISRSINSVTTLQDMIIDEKNEEDSLQTKECQYCGKINNISNSTCDSCGSNLE